MLCHAVVTEVAPAPFRGERPSRKVRREALEPEKLEERLPRPALAVHKEILERDRVHARVALRDAELPAAVREAGDDYYRRPLVECHGGDKEDGACDSAKHLYEST